MARQVRRISELPEATELTGDELLEIVQGGENHRVTVGQLSGGEAPVQSVQGRTGDVVITADDVGLGSVDNTSDADKPVSTAQQAALDGKVDSDDARLSDSREWSAATVTQAEAETGTATTRRAWTAQRVRQAIVAWWNSASSAFGRGFVASANAAAGRSALGLGTIATQNATNVTIASSTSVQVPLTLSRTSGLGDILRCTKATDPQSYFSISSGSSSAPMVPVFTSYSALESVAASYFVADCPSAADTGGAALIGFSARVNGTTVNNRPLMAVLNVITVRFQIENDGSVTCTAPVKPGSYTVATLPATAATGANAYATNGRKAGEVAGAGTGVPVYYQGGWRTYYDNSIVLA